MAYPDTPTRNENYYQDEQAHLTSPDPAKLDGELNEIFGWASAANARLRSITTADGHLKNFAVGTAESLAGSWEDTATAAQTDFLTDIVWNAVFTADNVAVYRNGLRLPASQVTAEEGTGSKLQVVIPASSAGDIVKVDAFESGAGVLATLASTATGEGASLIGVEDADDDFTGTTVEECLTETKQLLDSTLTSLGTIGDLIRADGTVPMAANLAMGTHKITGLVAGTTAGDAVEYSQFAAVAGGITDLSSFYLRLDGTTPMTAALNMNTHKITGVVDPADAQDAATKKYTDDTFVPKSGDITLTGTLGGEDPAAATDFTTKQYVDAALGQTYGTIVATTTAGTTSFNVPAAVNKLKVYAIGGGGGGGAYSSYGGGGGGCAYKFISVTPGESLTVVVGAGGGVGVDGSVSQLLRGASVLVEASGGRHGNVGSGLSGLGGAGTIGDFLQNGGQAGGTRNSGCGGAGAGPYGGAGGSNGIGAEAGRNGVSPGGGGGGAGDSSGAASGAAGAVIIFY